MIKPINKVGYSDQDGPQPKPCEKRIGGFQERNPPHRNSSVGALVHTSRRNDRLTLHEDHRDLFDMTPPGRPAPDTSGRPYNNLLRRLSAADYALLASHLAYEEAGPNDLLYSPGDDVEIVHFPCGPSLATYLVANEDGRDVETILVGREGAVGGIVSEGFLPAYTRIMVKFAGPFVRLPVGRLDAAKTASKTLRNVFARYADCMLAQIFQSTACNAIHSIEQRTAKWVISAMERTEDAETVPLTHEQLATLLGVGRSYTSRVIQTFKAEGIIETRRGSIVVRDRAALQSRACLCNESVKNHFEEVLRGVYPTEEVSGA
jgi:hypothetical protein